MVVGSQVWYSASKLHHLGEPISNLLRALQIETVEDIIKQHVISHSSRQVCVQGGLQATAERAEKHSKIQMLQVLRTTSTINIIYIVI